MHLFQSIARRAPLGFIAAAAFAASGCADALLSTPKIATSMTAALSSDAQTGVAGQALGAPLAVQVSDVNAAPMQGITVNWTVTLGGGALSSATSVTDATGIARVTFTLGTLAGANSVQAALPGAPVAAVAFAETGAAGPASQLAIASGNTQVVEDGAAAQPLIVVTEDQYGNPVGGVAVAWATSAGSISADTTVTDASGRAEVFFVAANSPQNYTVTTTSGSLQSAAFTETSIETSALRIQKP